MKFAWESQASNNSFHPRAWLQGCYFRRQARFTRTLPVGLLGLGMVGLGLVVLALALVLALVLVVLALVLVVVLVLSPTMAPLWLFPCSLLAT
jgi:hypothetical protein